MSRQPSRWSVGGVWKNAEVSPPSTRGCRALGTAGKTGARVACVHRAVRVGKTRRRRRARDPTLTHRVGQGDEVVLVGIGRQRSGVPHHLPPAGRGDPAGMSETEVPGVRLAGNGKRSHDCGRVRVDVRQRRHREMGTPGPTATTGNIHVRDINPVKWASTPDTRSRRRADVQPLRSEFMADSRSSGRGGAAHGGSRRGRDKRGPLLPQSVPGWRSRAERFDMAVLEAYEPIERRWQQRLTGLDVAVDEIPRISPRDPGSVQWPPEVVADGPIALARLIPAGVDVRGDPTRARIVLFRKPIERRAKTADDLTDLLHEILVAQVATHLGVDPSVIDPSIEQD